MLLLLQQEHLLWPRGRLELQEPLEALAEQRMAEELLVAEQLLLGLAVEVDVIIVALVAMRRVVQPVLVVLALQALQTHLQILALSAVAMELSMYILPILPQLTLQNSTIPTMSLLAQGIWLSGEQMKMALSAYQKLMARMMEN